MNTLFEKSIRTLELPVVLEMLASLAVSEAAKEKCRQLLPVCDLEEAARLQEETQSARERLGLYGSPSFSGVKDVSRALNRADHGGVLNTRELLDVADLLTASRRVSEYDRDRQGGENRAGPPVLRPAHQQILRRQDPRSHFGRGNHCRLRQPRACRHPA